ncbi:hypothetical protein PUN28_004920 [Cardiocondyla obscurior]|uniref:Uncharacterized protein n=1 Tax=Cardiocondyla obscurior TaxID=286306 RepID=A0AAW2GI83_9HYME
MKKYLIYRITCELAHPTYTMFLSRGIVWSLLNIYPRLRGSFVRSKSSLDPIGVEQHVGRPAGRPSYLKIVYKLYDRFAFSQTINFCAGTINNFDKRTSFITQIQWWEYVPVTDFHLF